MGRRNFQAASNHVAWLESDNASRATFIAMIDRNERQPLIGLILPRAMLFDMDGTLTAPYFDFSAIRREIGIDAPILESIAKMDDAKRQAAEEILHRHEDRCAAECELNPGCEELIEWLHAQKVKLAVVTRNSRKSASTVFARHNIRIDNLELKTSDLTLERSTG